MGGGRDERVTHNQRVLALRDWTRRQFVTSQVTARVPLALADLDKFPPLVSSTTTLALPLAFERRYHDYTQSKFVYPCDLSIYLPFYPSSYF